jgi:hypothetical protein
MNFSYDPRKHTKIGILASLRGSFRIAGLAIFSSYFGLWPQNFRHMAAPFDALTIDSNKDVSGKSARVPVKRGKHVRLG